MNFKSNRTIILALAAAFIITGCKKEKPVEFNYPPFEPAGNGGGTTTVISGTSWTSIEPSFVASHQIQAMLPLNSNKMLLTYLTTGSISGTYDGTTFSQIGQSLGSGGGLDELKMLDGVPYGVGLLGSYGAYSYDASAGSYPWNSEAAVGTNIYSIERFGTSNIISCPQTPYVRSNESGSYAQMGSAFSSAPNDFIVFNGTLIAAGGFTTIGSTSVNRVAQWNGSDWEPLGTGLNGTIIDLEVYDGKLIAVGGFTQTTDGAPCRYVAQWDGSTWSALSTTAITGGSNGIRRAYAYGNQLFLGGDFDYAGTVVSPNIIKWNGTSYEAMGPGAPDIVGEICVIKGHLYIANEFYITGGNFLLRLD